MTHGEAKKMLEQMPLDFDVFPSLSQIEEYRKKFTHQKPEKPKGEVEWWVSTQAPGTPANFEFLFLSIESGKTDTRAFKYGLGCTKMTEEQVWECYQAWKDGKVHPHLTNRSTKTAMAELGILTDGIQY